MQGRNNLLLPEWVGSVYPNHILKYALEALKIETENSDITKLTTGNKIIFVIHKYLALRYYFVLY